MKFAVFTVTTPEWTHEQVVSNLAEQGWDGVEWAIKDFPAAETPSFRAGNRAVWPETGLRDSASRLGALTRHGGLEISALGSYALSHEREKVDLMLWAAAETGAGQVRINAPHVRSANYRDLFEWTRQDFAWIAARARDYGVKALVELHHRLVTASSSAALRLVDGLDSNHVGVIHDMGNTVVEGQEDYLSSFEMLGPYLAHVHIKNVRWVADQHPDALGTTHYTHEWAPLHAGQASLSAYFQALRRFGYNGWVTLEDFTVDLPLAERLKANLAYIKAVHAEVEDMQVGELCSDPADYMIASTLRPVAAL